MSEQEAPRIFSMSGESCGRSGPSHSQHWSWDFGPLGAVIEQDADGTWSWRCGDTGCSGEASLSAALLEVEKELSAIADAIIAAKAKP